MNQQTHFPINQSINSNATRPRPAARHHTTGLLRLFCSRADVTTLEADRQRRKSPAVLPQRRSVCDRPHQPGRPVRGDTVAQQLYAFLDAYRRALEVMAR